MPPSTQAPVLSPGMGMRVGFPCMVAAEGISPGASFITEYFMAEEGTRVKQSDEAADYKDPSRLKKFLTERGKVLPRRMTGLSAKQQRQISLAIKRARHLGLLPYVNRE